jgi:hypothetical protein
VWNRVIFSRRSRLLKSRANAVQGRWRFSGCISRSMKLRRWATSAFRAVTKKHGLGLRGDIISVDWWRNAISPPQCAANSLGFF